jgi:hypothetical protein
MFAYVYCGSGRKFLALLDINMLDNMLSTIVTGDFITQNMSLAFCLPTCNHFYFNHCIIQNLFFKKTQFDKNKNKSKLRDEKLWYFLHHM